MESARDALLQEKYHQEDLQRLRGFRPIDDTFMRCLFRDNLPLAQFVLRIITGKPDLILTREETQKDLKRLLGARAVSRRPWRRQRRSGIRYRGPARGQGRKAGAGPVSFRGHGYRSAGCRSGI